jgi:hypothetical protein
MKIERPLVVLGVAVAARIPGRRAEAAGENAELPVPGMPVAADAVEEENERPPARERKREARRAADENGLQAYSARAPEIFTARPRLSKSCFM